jgi:hypothetical protein
MKMTITKKKKEKKKTYFQTQMTRTLQNGEFDLIVNQLFVNKENDKEMNRTRWI